MARALQFHLSQLFGLVVIFALFFALRAWWITSEIEILAPVLPIVLAAIAATFAAFSGKTYWPIFVVAGGVGFTAYVAIALECIFKSPATEFLRRDPIATQYATDLQLHFHFAFMVALFATVLGGSLGSLVRLIVEISQRTTTSPTEP